MGEKIDAFTCEQVGRFRNRSLEKFAAICAATMLVTGCGISGKLVEIHLSKDKLSKFTSSGNKQRTSGR